MTGTAEFSTERLRMRRYRMDDAPLLFARFGCDPQMFAYSGWNPYATREMAEETVQRFIGSYGDPDFYGWAIEYQGQMIGIPGQILALDRAVFHGHVAGMPETVLGVEVAVVKDCVFQVLEGIFALQTHAGEVQIAAA